MRGCEGEGRTDGTRCAHAVVHPNDRTSSGARGICLRYSPVCFESGERCDGCGCGSRHTPRLASAQSGESTGHWAQATAGRQRAGRQAPNGISIRPPVCSFLLPVRCPVSGSPRASKRAVCDGGRPAVTASGQRAGRQSNETESTTTTQQGAESGYARSTRLTVGVRFFPRTLRPLLPSRARRRSRPFNGRDGTDAQPQTEPDGRRFVEVRRRGGRHQGKFSASVYCVLELVPALRKRLHTTLTGARALCSCRVLLFESIRSMLPTRRCCMIPTALVARQCGCPVVVR
jgi:hypothetical protein